MKMRDFDLEGMKWIREPASSAQMSPTTIAWTSSPTSDFWRHTGAVAPKHDGNAFLRDIGAGDFSFDAEVSGVLTDRYDQFGVFVEIDEEHWVKAGIELDDSFWLSTVATKTHSDWAREKVVGAQVRLRVARHSDTIEIFVDDSGSWRMIRELTLAGDARVGLYSCSPKGNGFSALGNFRPTDTQP